ncbi:MAG: UPF0280 family protein [Hadesarchaea archaeon]|jgi:ApbE superfamily uncharacterized protein (UPF0280 family)|nr:UPF0280 family protein [Hadesarchaea archaeon]
MISLRWSYRETHLLVKADNREAARASVLAAFRARREVERFLLRHPEFRHSLEPLSFPGEELPRVVELMVRAGQTAGVGPFAAVAGAIAQLALEGAKEAGAVNVVVENGGDIALDGRRGFSVGIFAGDHPLSGKLALSLTPAELPAGVCTSSGTVGPSLNFGWADAVTVISDEASLSDAAATSISNEVRGEAEEAVGKGLERAREIPGVRGCLILFGDRVGAVGRLPRLSWVGGRLPRPPSWSLPLEEWLGR